MTLQSLIDLTSHCVLVILKQWGLSFPPKNASLCYCIGLNLTDFPTTFQLFCGVFVLFVFSPQSLLHLWCSKSKMISLQIIAYKSLIILYYCQILDSILLSKSFLSVKTGFVLLFLNWLIIGLIDLNLCTAAFKVNKLGWSFFTWTMRCIISDLWGQYESVPKRNTKPMLIERKYSIMRDLQTSFIFVLKHQIRYTTCSLKTYSKTKPLSCAFKQETNLSLIAPSQL